MASSFTRLLLRSAAYGSTLRIPIPQSIPTIVGTAGVGDVLSVVSASFQPSPHNNFFKWYVGGVVVPGATSTSYIPVLADVGKTVEVEQIGTTTAGASVPVRSLPTNAVVNAGGLRYIVPGIGWNGTPDSGGLPPAGTFSKSTYNDPQAIFAPLFWSSTNVEDAEDTILAFDGDCFGGVQKVEIFCEGNTYDITDYIRQDYVSARNEAKYYLGYICRIVKARLPADVFGSFNVYATMTPNNPAVVARRLGPFRFFHVGPSMQWSMANPAAKYGRTVECAPSLAEVTDTGVGGTGLVRRNTWVRAAKYLRDNAFINGRVLLKESTRYKFEGAGGSNPTSVNGQIGSNTTGVGWIRTEAAPGINAVFGPTVNDNWRDKRCEHTYDGLWFKGPGINIETQYVQWIKCPNGAARGFVFEGITGQDASGRYGLFEGGARPVSTWPQPSYTKDCFYNGCQATMQSPLCINNHMIGFNNMDIAGSLHYYTITGNLIEDSDRDGYRNGLVSMTLTYTGSGTAGLIIGTDAGANTATVYITLNGSTVFGPYVGSTQNSSMQTLVDAINTQVGAMGFSAVNLHNDNYTTAYDRAVGTLTAINVVMTSGVPVNLVSSINPHYDFLQIETNSHQYGIITRNTLVRVSAQTYIFQQQMNDYLIENNASYKPVNTDGLKSWFMSEQYHVMFRHNTLTGQEALIRTNTAPDHTYTADAFTEYYGNAFERLATYQFSNNLNAWKYNHAASGDTITTASNNMVISGTIAANFEDVVNGKFEPRGPLAATSVPIRGSAKYDVNGKVRLTNDARGAVARP